MDGQTDKVSYKPYKGKPRNRNQNKCKCLLTDKQMDQENCMLNAWFGKGYIHQNKQQSILNCSRENHNFPLALMNDGLVFRQSELYSCFHTEK